jgi:hypothetical protein
VDRVLGQGVPGLSALDGSSGSTTALSAPGLAPSDRFGAEVAISSDDSTAVVTAPWHSLQAVQCAPGGEGDDCQVAGPGAAYVFTNAGGSWGFSQTLTASDGANQDDFGSSVAVSGNGSTIVIGADGATPGGLSVAGSAYVFTSSGGSWSQTAEFSDPGGSVGDEFGNSVAVNSVAVSGQGGVEGNTVVVGAVASSDDQGAAYAYRNDGSGWSAPVALSPSNGGEATLAYGLSASLDATGADLVVGAAGMSFLFRLVAGVYQQTQNVPVSAGIVDPEGVYIAGSTSSTAVGIWTIGSEAITATLSAADGNPGDAFGASLAFDPLGDALIVGAPDHPYTSSGTPAYDGPGAAYVFTQDPSLGDWTETGEISDPAGDYEDSFGSVALSDIASGGLSAGVGAPLAPVDQSSEVGGPGEAYIFTGPFPAPQTTPNLIRPGTASGSADTVTTGSSVSVTINSSGTPRPKLTEKGKLPKGLSFHDNGDGTGTLSGTPAATAGGTYEPVFTGTFGKGKAATTGTLTVALTVDQPPAISAKAPGRAKVGKTYTFVITATGYPGPALSESGALPAGVGFTDNGSGRATLSGKPASGTAGSYDLDVTASNGVGSPASRTLTLVVKG